MARPERRYQLAYIRPTCRMAVCEYPPDCVFYEDHHWTDPATGEVHHGHLVPENTGMDRARVGQQRGTHFKASLTRTHSVWGEMTVWYWGGVHPADRAQGVCAS